MMDDQERREALAREERRIRRQRLCILLSMLGLCSAVGAVIVWMESPRAFGSGGWLTWLIIGLGLLAMIVGALLAQRFRPNDDTMKLTIGSYRDRVQRQRAHSMAIIPASGAYLTFLSVKAGWGLASGTAGGTDYLSVGLGPIVAGLMLLMVAGLDNRRDKRMKRLLDDELTLSFRHRALATALGVAAVGMAGVFALGLWRPAAAVAALPALLYLTGTAAVLRYYLLDREADRG